MGALALAFVAGVISFTSPCCLPLMPGYVSYVGGIEASGGTGSVTTRTRTMTASVLFVAGFTAAFTMMGFAASSLSGVILQHRIGLERIAGAVVVAMGLAMLGVLRVPILAREARPIDLRRIRPGVAGAARSEQPSRSAGRRASGRCSRRSLRRPPRRRTHGGEQRCCSRTRSASGFRSSCSRGGMRGPGGCSAGSVDMPEALRSPEVRSSSSWVC